MESIGVWLYELLTGTTPLANLELAPALPIDRCGDEENVTPPGRSGRKQ
jgi:hypothetical protein